MFWFECLTDAWVRQCCALSSFVTRNNKLHEQNMHFILTQNNSMKSVISRTFKTKKKVYLRSQKIWIFQLIKDDNHSFLISWFYLCFATEKAFIFGRLRSTWRWKSSRCRRQNLDRYFRAFFDNNKSVKAFHCDSVTNCDTLSHNLWLIVFKTSHHYSNSKHPAIDGMPVKKITVKCNLESVVHVFFFFAPLI